MPPGAARAVVDLLGEAMGWGPERKNAELDAYTGMVEGELAAEGAWDDVSQAPEMTSPPDFKKKCDGRLR